MFCTRRDCYIVLALYISYGRSLPLGVTGQAQWFMAGWDCVMTSSRTRRPAGWKEVTADSWFCFTDSAYLCPRAVYGGRKKTSTVRERGWELKGSKCFHGEERAKVLSQ